MKEMFSEEDVEQGRQAAREADGCGNADAEVHAIMTCAFALAAARGGTMEPTRLERLRRAYDRMTSRDFEDLFNHLSAQGARLAVAEQERDKTLADWREYKVAKDKDVDGWKAECDTLKTQVEALSTEARDWCVRYERAAAEVVEWSARYPATVASLREAGAVLSAHVDKTAGEARRPENDDDTFVTIPNGVEGSVFTRSQLERAREQSAEAMRAACIIAVREALSNVGAWDRDTERLVTVALEGATP